MRRISKGAEPSSLAVRRATPGANKWDAVHGDERQDMRDALYAEQHGLCAYCLSRLSATTKDAMKIEHYVARSVDGTKQLCWQNLLGVCPGDRGIGPPGFHCDTSRGDQELFVDPVRYPPDAASLFEYVRTTGEVRPNGELAKKERGEVAKTIDALKLNLHVLKRNRAAVIERLRNRFKSGKMTRSRIEELLDAHRTPLNGRLPEYCEVGRTYLEKKARQIAAG